MSKPESKDVTADYPSLPDGYTLTEFPPVPRQIIFPQYQATAPDGTQGSVYTSPDVALQTAITHERTGKWYPPDVFVILDSDYDDRDG